MVGLFDALPVGTRHSRNRIVALPHGAGLAEDGRPTRRLAEYLGRIARGSAGLVVVGGSEVDDSTWPSPGNLLLTDPRTTELLEPVYAGVHEASSLVVNQLTHLGREGLPARPGRPLLSPGPDPSGFVGVAPAAMTRRDIDDVLSGYARAAANVFAAGADGVEVHAAHGYLLQQFLSPLTNTRGDEYGGDAPARSRLLVQILTGLRTVHSGQIIGVRLSAGEPRPGGLPWSDVLDLATALVRDDLIDYVSLAVASYSRDYIKDGLFEPGGLRARSRELRDRLDGRVPVIVSQRINRPEVAEDIIGSGDADAVGMARALIADPDFGTKAARGEAATIRPCLACLQNCRHGSEHPLSCAVNPRLGFGADRSGKTSGRYLVVGGGPAGVLAALRLREGGAHVVLAEREARLGGQLWRAGSVTARTDWSRYAAYLAGELDRAGVDVLLDTAVDVNADQLDGYDGIVLALGPTEPDPPDGLPLPVSTVDKFLRGPVPDGPIAVVDEDGTWRAATVVLRLIEAGVACTYITARERVFDRIPRESRAGLIARLTSHAAVHVSTTVRAGPAGVELVHYGQTSPLAAAGLVWSAPPRPAARLLLDVLAPVPAVLIGDCLTPRGISEACEEGWRVDELLARGRP